MRELTEQSVSRQYVITLCRRGAIKRERYGWYTLFASNAREGGARLDTLSDSDPPDAIPF
jgi:hypothetical protein